MCGRLYLCTHSNTTAICNPHRDVDPDEDLHPDPNVDSDSHTDADVYANAGVDSDRNPNGVLHAESDCDTDPHADRDASLDGDGIAHANGDEYPDAHRDTHGLRNGNRDRDWYRNGDANPVPNCSPNADRDDGADRLVHANPCVDTHARGHGDADGDQRTVCHADCDTDAFPCTSADRVADHRAGDALSGEYAHGHGHRDHHSATANPLAD